MGQAVSIIFSGDIRYLPSLAGFAKNSDVLVHEAVLAKKLDHVLAKTRTVDDRLKNHLVAAHSFDGGCSVGHDGLAIEL